MFGSSHVAGRSAVQPTFFLIEMEPEPVSLGLKRR
jgi:hypothetical protein